MKIFNGKQEWLDKPDSEGWWWYRPLHESLEAKLEIIQIIISDWQDKMFCYRHLLGDCYLMHMPSGKWQKAITPEDYLRRGING